MGLLEDSLRDTFAHRVDGAPVVDGLADRVIASAHRVRRRHALVASTAVATAVALIAFGGLTIAGRPGPQVGPGMSTSPSAEGSARPSVSLTTAAPATGLPIDVLADSTIYLAGGGTLPLSNLSGSVSQAWRVDTGYLVSTYDYGATQPSASLWYVPTSDPHTPRLLVTGGGVMVARGTPQRPGIQIGWRDAAGVHLGVFAGGAVGNVVSTQVPDVNVSGLAWTVSLYPHAVVGGALVLAGTLTGGGPDVWDDWLPAHGGYVPTIGAAPFVPMLAATADGEYILGPESSKSGCLGEYDPAGFAMVKQLCPSPVPSAGFLDPSPDGRWWLSADPSVGVRLFDTQTVWNGSGPLRTWSVGAVAGAWVDASRVLLLTSTFGAVILNAQDGSSEQVALPASVHKPIIVADLR
jgi:hypothetical protein